MPDITLSRTVFEMTFCISTKIQDDGQYWKKIYIGPRGAVFSSGPKICAKLFLDLTVFDINNISISAKIHDGSQK